MLVALLAANLGTRILPRAWYTLNTDFPNYYLTARLLSEHYDTSRVFEWVWLQRQKDHRDIAQRTVGMVPITPFSTLAVYPLASMPALAAKRCWLILNLGLLFATLSLLHALTYLPWRRISLVFTLSLPLTINFAFGQYYVLLLFLLTLSCWLDVRQRRFLAGIVVGIAAGLKIFPVLYLLYFLRKGNGRAFAGGVAGSLCTAIVSVLAFGWELNRTYLVQVLPSVLRGEGLDPYNLQLSSLGSLLHRLFVYEPQLNQHPAMNAPWLFAVLHPLLQMMIMAPSLLLAVPNESRPSQIRLEWAAITLASLAISTSPASYLFTLLILPISLILGSLQGKKSALWVAIILPLYAAAGFVRGIDEGRDGWFALLRVPRLYMLVLLCVFAYALLFRERQREVEWSVNRAWAVALSLLLAIGIVLNLRHQKGLYADYQWRIPLPKPVLMAANPAIQEDSVLFIALLSDGYHLAVDRLGTVQFSDINRDDYLTMTTANGERWIEQTGHETTIVSSAKWSEGIRQAESPVASFDGRWLAFLRENHGRAGIWVRDLSHPVEADRPVTPPELNVLEMSFLPNGELVFSGASEGPPGLFTTDQAGKIQSLGMTDARYPSVSPDGRWLAYSELDGGNWNLRLRDMKNGQTHKFTQAACNSIEPSWSSDSQSLIYASDCGRGLCLTALCRRRIFH